MMKTLARAKLKLSRQASSPADSPGQGDLHANQETPQARGISMPPRRLSRPNSKRLARTKATSGLQRGTLSCSSMAARINPRPIGLISTCRSRLPRTRFVEVVAARQGRPLQAAPHPLSSIRPSSEGFHRRVLPRCLSHLHNQPLSEVVSGSLRRQPQPHNRLRGAEAACSGLVS